MVKDEYYLEKWALGKCKIFPWWYPTAITSGQQQAFLSNFLDGEWVKAKKYKPVIDPLNGKQFIWRPDTSEDEIEPFIKSMEKCPRYGLHNPLHNPERYKMYGEICAKAARFLRTETGRSYFAHLIQRVMPKDINQCLGEVDVVATFLETFSGDSVRFLANGRTTPGDHFGQLSMDYRWPYGPVAIIYPFNFPIEIPVLQLLGASFMGNKVIIKADSKVGIVIEAFIRLLLDCGMPKDDVLLIHCKGSVMEKIVKNSVIQMLQFTGGSETAEHLKGVIPGEIKWEDSGFDWKILGSNVVVDMIDAVAEQDDKDACAASKQKCSARSIMFMHENWVHTDLIGRIRGLAKKRNLKDLTVGPVLTWNNKQIQKHIDKLLKIPRAELMFGNKPLPDKHNIPEEYGSWENTLVFVPLDQILPNFDLVTTEVFGPVSVITTWGGRADLDIVLITLERIKQRLTAGIVENDPEFQWHVLAHTSNGVTYVGLRAKTTGAPTNHNFGPTGPHSAGIGTPEAIIDTWSQNRTIVFDINAGKYQKI